MSVAIVTGSAGLIGSEASRYFAARGLDVVGIDNDMRSRFFGDEASTRWQQKTLQDELGASYRHVNLDIRASDQIDALFAEYHQHISLVVHTAAQPSHDWAAREPHTDFSVNATGTLNLLEATRQHAHDACFIFTSTNKVYGDTPNRLPLLEHEKRWEIDPSHSYHSGIREDMSIDQTKHSLFGASKVAADIMVQEYGRYFEMNTGIFRGGCLTGPNHSGTQLHGFLAYLMKCTATGTPYQVFGYKGKQVRDNIHSNDLIRAFDAFFQAPRQGEVYNIGGARFSNCSMLEAIDICQEVSGRELTYTYQESNRIGDHIWWVSDVSKFQEHYPSWQLQHNVRDIIAQIYEQNVDRWSASGLVMIDRGKHNLIGVNIHAVDYDAAVHKIINAAKTRRPLGVSALAVHGVMTGVLDREHRYRLNQLELVVPDGQPVRWALNWLHKTDLTDRVYGPHLMLEACRAAATYDQSVFLFGGSEELLGKLVANLQEKFPALQIAGMQASKFRQLSEDEKQETIDVIRASGASICMVGLGCPRQEVWAYEFREGLSMPVLAVGAAFNFHAGMLDQAPSAWQRNGFEWLYRLIKEPRRLWQRYLLLNPLYVSMVALQWLRLRRFDPTTAREPTEQLWYG